MLTILLERYEQEALRSRDLCTVERCLADEHERLLDEKHLRNMVLEDSEYDWDFRVLDRGFHALVAPYMQEHSYSATLFLRALDELGATRPALTRATVLIEYAYYANLINDTFNFSPLFAASSPPPIRECEAITQLRYAGQYLSKYPGYLLTHNLLEVDDDTLLELHRWFAGAYVSLGINRGVLVRWAREGFKEVNAAAFAQNAINGLINYVEVPVVLAALLAGIRGDTLTALKRALSHLTLCAKLSCEIRICRGTLSPETTAARAGTFLPMRFPGYVTVSNHWGSHELTGHDDSTGLAAVDQRVRALAATADLDAALKPLHEQFKRSLDAFRTHMKEARLLEHTADALVASLSERIVQ